MVDSIYDFSASTVNGETKSLADYRGKTLLIVNTASKCGFTPQFEGLEALYQKLNQHGLEILAFPCNQFGNQDPGSNEEILEFCLNKYSISFPLFAKLDVNGSDAHPLYKFLRTQAPGVLGTTAIKWNFTKFLIDTDGSVVNRFPPNTLPAELESVIVSLSIPEEA